MGGGGGRKGSVPGGTMSATFVGENLGPRAPCALSPGVEPPPQSPRPRPRRAPRAAAGSGARHSRDPCVAGPSRAAGAGPRRRICRVQIWGRHGWAVGSTPERGRGGLGLLPVSLSPRASPSVVSPTPSSLSCCAPGQAPPLPPTHPTFTRTLPFHGVPFPDAGFVPNGTFQVRNSTALFAPRTWVTGRKRVGPST